MSKTFRKSMLRAGQTFHSPDGEVKVTPERLQHWSNTFKRMSDAGQIIPMHWDHGSALDDFTPITMSEFKNKSSHSARNTIGHLKKFEVAPGGTHADVEFVTFDDAAAKAMETNAVRLSPVILDSWQDGAANTYEDAITHLDFVDHAVDYLQGPAEEVSEAVCCSIRMGLTQAHPVKAFRMAFPDDEEKKPDDETPADDAPSDPPAEDPADEETPEDAPAGEATIGKTLELLAKMEIVLPSDTAGTNFIDRLYTALLTATAMEGGEEETPNEETQVVDPQIQTMSLENKTLRAHAEKQHRAGIKAELDALLQSGRCTPAEYKARSGAVGAIKLSLDSKGEPRPSDVEAFIESRKPVPAGTFWDDDSKIKRMSLSHPEPMNVRIDAKAPLTKEQEDELVNRHLGRK